MNAPSQEKVIRFLKELIEKQDSHSTKGLPSCKELSQMTGTAYITVWKAIQKLKKEGIIDTRQGTRLAAVKSEITSPVSKVTHNSDRRWTGVAENLLSDLQGGKYPPFVHLPSIKILSQSYDTSYKTMTKALRKLVEDGYLSNSPRGYRISQTLPNSPVSRYTVTVITKSDNKIVPINPIFSRNNDVISAFEYVCHKLDLQLKLLFVKKTADENELRDDITSESALNLGFILWTRGMNEAEIHDSHRQLATFKKPIAILDETGMAESCVKRTSSSASIGVFPLGTEIQNGIDVGRYLLSKGHKDIAVIAPVKNSSRFKRIEGIRQVYRSSGIVYEYYLDEFTKEKGIDGQLVYQTDDDTSAVVADIENLFNGVPPTVTTEMYKDVLLQLADVVVHKISRQKYYERLKPLLQNILAKKQVTTWVGINDFTAIACQQFLCDNGIKVPEEIAVIGFDDTIDAMAEGLTSYNFDVFALVQAMLVFLTSAKFRFHAYVHKKVCSGYITERYTT